MKRPDICILSHPEIAHVLTMERAIAAVEKVMTAHGRNRVIDPNLLHADVPQGEFHIKTGGVLHGTDGGVFGLKANGGFFGNHTLGLPNIVGVIYLADAQTGCPLAILDSVEISRVRTGAATAVAARRLARPESSVLTVVGTGTQARTQIEALCHILPIKRVRLVGRDRVRTTTRAAEFEAILQVAVEPSTDIEQALKGADVLVTCTPARAPIVPLRTPPPGLFIAAVGADSPGKQELTAALTARCTVVADVLHQCIHVGELQHAIQAGLLTPDQVHAELGAVLCGLRPGRTSAEEVTLYDSTGTALQDVAVGFEVLEAAQACGLGQSISLGG
ncbi:MAG: ornithine cyclodeaminase family protein [Rhodobacterales bacterium]|nr:ornithine cyclodeaminase family protein [Rhodobacterales bacterium]